MSTVTLTLRPQETPFTDRKSAYMFQPSGSKPFRVTPAAQAEFGSETINSCLEDLQQLAREHHGLQYVQVFEEEGTAKRLWFIEDCDGGAITALLPSDY